MSFLKDCCLHVCGSLHRGTQAPAARPFAIVGDRRRAYQQLALLSRLGVAGRTGWAPDMSRPHRPRTAPHAQRGETTLLRATHRSYGKVLGGSAGLQRQQRAHTAVVWWRKSCWAPSRVGRAHRAAAAFPCTSVTSVERLDFAAGRKCCDSCDKRLPLAAFKEDSDGGGVL